MTSYPNLFILGAAKAGTTALFSGLAQHPDISMCSVKEPHFFTEKISSNLVTDEHQNLISSKEEYLKLFKLDNDIKYAGEGSTSYLWDSSVPQKIFDYNPDAKLIVILRNPLDRAYSHYKMDVHSEREKEADFLKALKTDQKRTHRVWGKSRLYVDLGFYAQPIESYLRLFGDQLMVIPYEEFKEAPDLVYQRIWDFLDLDRIFLHYQQVNQATSYNKIGRKMKSTGMGKLLPAPAKPFLKKILSPSKDAIPKDAYRYLRNIYYEDIKKLSKLGFHFYDELI